MSAVVSPEGEPRRSGLREGAVLVLVSTALVTLLYLIPPTIFESEDYVKLHSINRAYRVASLLSGRLPLWNPHVGLGRPFLADMETAAFYPPSLLYLAFEPHLCLVLLLIAHTALLLWGSLQLCRFVGVGRRVAWLVGAAFAASGAVVGTIHKGLIPYGEAIAWLPLLVLLAARLQDGFSLRRAAELALGLGLQLLCGHPQIAWLTWWGLALFLGARAIGGSASESGRRLAAGGGGLALALAAGLGLAALQLLPFAELVGQGNRSRPTLAFASSGGLEWSQWASLFLPAGAGPPVVFGASFYVGTLLTIAGAAGLTRLGDRNVRGLAAVVVLGILYSVGERTPLFAVMYELVPGLSSFRFPGRMGVVVSLALLLAAGMFLAETTARRSALLVCGMGGALVVLAVAGWRPDLPGETTLARLVRSVLAAGGVALLLLWHLRSRVGPRAGRWAAAAIAAVALAEIALTSAAHRPFRAGLAPFPGERAVVRALGEAGLLRRDAPPPRVFVPYPAIRDNSGMLYGFSNPSGYVALTLESVWIYLHESLGLDVPAEANTFPAAGIYGFGPFPYPSASLALGFDRSSSRLVLNPDVAPRAWVAHAVEIVSDVRAAVARLRAGQDRHLVTLVAPVEGPLPSASGPWPEARAQIASFAPERIVIEVETSQPGLLVVGEAWYPGWRATVNGRPAACYQANAWMRAVPITAGRSQVVLTFRSSYLALGAAISVASLGLCLAARRRFRAGPPPSTP